MAASDSSYDSAARHDPRVPGSAAAARNAPSNAPNNASSNAPSAAQPTKPQSQYASAPASALASGQASGPAPTPGQLWSAPYPQAGAKPQGPWSGYPQSYGAPGLAQSAAQLTSAVGGPLGPGLSPFGMPGRAPAAAPVSAAPGVPGASASRPAAPASRSTAQAPMAAAPGAAKPRGRMQNYVPAATPAQDEYLFRAATQDGHRGKTKVASAQDLADEFAAELAQEQQLHPWPSDPAARTKVSVAELIANAPNSLPSQQPPQLIRPHGRVPLASAAPDLAQQDAVLDQIGAACDQQGAVSASSSAGTAAAGGGPTVDLQPANVDSGALLTAEPLGAELVALTPKEQLEQSIGQRDAKQDSPLGVLSALALDEAMHGGTIAAGDSGVKEQDEFAGFEQAAQLRRNDRRRTQKAVSALDLLLKHIEERSGIKVDEVEVDPFEYYVIRKNETQAVAAEVAQRKEEYFRSFIDKLRTEGQINPKYTLERLTHDDFNHHAFTLGERFVREVVSAGGRKMFLLFGDMGTGKTVLAHALANLFMDLKAQEPSLFAQRTNTQTPLCMVVTLDELKRSWFYVNEETYEQRSERERKLKQYYEVDLLVLDGLCSDFVALSPFNQRSLSDLLRYRSEHLLPMIVTTPIRWEALHKAIGDAVYEGIRSFEVAATALLGGSRRPPLMINGAVIP